MTEKVKGMTIEEAENYQWQNIVDELGGLPKQKIHCSIMAVEGLKKVLAEYRKTHPQEKATK
jgi:NifU-like protein involved in Fe-S cluster formation